MRVVKLPEQAKAWQVVDAVRARGGASRAQVVADTGLPWASVSTITEDLVRRRVLAEATGDNARIGRAGRRSALLRLPGEVGSFLGVEVGASAIRVTQLDFNFRVRELGIDPQPTGTDLAVVLTNIRAVMARALAAIPAERLLGVGFAWPGSVDPTRGTARFAPNLPLASDLTLSDLLTAEQSERLRLKPVVITRASECTAVAEQAIGGADGHGRAERQIAVVTVGAAVGAGLILDGKLFHGRANAAGELGHIIVNEASAHRCGCGRSGCLEQEIAEPALLRKARERLGLGPEVTAEALAAAATAGDPGAQQLFHELGEWLGKGLACVVNLLNPDLIVIAGGIAGAYDLFYPALRETLDRRCWRYGLANLRIERSRLGLDDTAIGAAIGAYHRLRTTTVLDHAPSQL